MPAPKYRQYVLGDIVIPTKPGKKGYGQLYAVIVVPDRACDSYRLKRCNGVLEIKVKAKFLMTPEEWSFLQNLKGI
jgi:hypothetical protein